MIKKRLSDWLSEINKYSCVEDVRQTLTTIGEAGLVLIRLIIKNESTYIEFSK